jgi:MFS family permease
VNAVGQGRRARQFGVLCVHTLLFQAVTFLLRPTASYRAIELGVDPALLGLLAAGFALVPLLVALPAGDLSDRYGENRVMLAGAVLIAGSAGLLALTADTFSLLLVGMVVLGTGHLLCAVGQQSMVANLMPPGRFDSAFGYYTFAGSIGQAAGPGLLALFGHGEALPRSEEAFVAAAAVSGALVVVTAFARRTPRPGRTPRAGERKVASLLRTPGLPRALVVSSLVLAAMDITLVYLPALGAEAGLSVGVVSALLAARAVATMLSRLFTGALTAWVGRRVLLVVSIGAAGLATAVVPLPVPLWLVAAAVVVMGFGLGVCQPATLAWLAEIAPPGLRGRVMSLRLVGNRFGQVVVPSGIGLVAAGLGAAGVLWVTAGTLLGAAAASRSVPMDGGAAAPRPRLRSHPRGR